MCRACVKTHVYFAIHLFTGNEPQGNRSSSKVWEKIQSSERNTWQFQMWQSRGIGSLGRPWALWVSKHYNRSVAVANGCGDQRFRAKSCP